MIIIFKIKILCFQTCSECRQLKSALVLEITGKERFRFGYEQLSSVEKYFIQKKNSIKIALRI